MQKSTGSQRGYILAILAAVQWSLMGIFGKALFAYQVPPLTVVALRATLVFITLVVVLILYRREWLAIQAKDWLFFIAYGLIGVAAGFLLYFTAIDLVGAAVAAILLYTYPVFVAFLSAFFLSERITPPKIIALALVLAGAALASGIGASTAAHINSKGVIVALLSAVTVATHSIFGKKAVQRYSTWTVLLYSMGFGALFLMLAQFIFLGPPDLRQPPVFWLLLIALAWIATLGANLAYVSSLKYIEASRASITATLEPALVAMLAYLFLNETLSPIQIAGMGFILAGVLVVQK